MGAPDRNLEKPSVANAAQPRVEEKKSCRLGKRESLRILAIWHHRIGVRYVLTTSSNISKLRIPHVQDPPPERPDGAVVADALPDAARLPVAPGVPRLVQQPAQRHGRGRRADQQGARRTAALHPEAVPASTTKVGRREAAPREVRARDQVPAVKAAAKFVRGLHGEFGHAGDARVRQLPGPDQRPNAAAEGERTLGKFIKTSLTKCRFPII